jgi:lipopolysaccharide transport system ATP-binding protein
MMAVEDLCHRALWLKEGQIVERGEPKAVVSAYLEATISSHTQKVWHGSSAPEHEDVQLLRAGVRPAGGASTDTITVRTPLELDFEYRNLRPNQLLSLSIALHNEQGIVVFTSGTGYDSEMPVGDYRSVCRVPGDLLNDGVHRVSVYLDKNGHTVLQDEDVLVFDVQDSVDYRDGWHGEWVGAVRPMLEWSTEFVEPK